MALSPAAARDHEPEGAVAGSVAAGGFDLDSLFIVHKGNLAVVHEAQALLADAAHEIARVQYDQLQQLLTGGRRFASVIGSAEPAAVLGYAHAALEGAVATASTVAHLALDAHHRVGHLLARRARSNMDEFGPFGA